MPVFAGGVMVSPRRRGFGRGGELARLARGWPGRDPGARPGRGESRPDPLALAPPGPRGSIEPADVTGAAHKPPQVSPA